jgi:PKD repeat protein
MQIQMKLVSTLIAICLCNLLLAQIPTLEWVKQYGDSYLTTAKAGHTEVDGMGNVYTFGTFWGTVDLDPGPAELIFATNGVQDVFITKCDYMGNLVWAKVFGGAMEEDILSCAVDAEGNVYAAGFSDGTMDIDPGVGVVPFGNDYYPAYILKLNSNGDFVWAKEFNSNASWIWQQIFIEALTIDVEGNLVVAGNFGGTVDFDPNAAVSNLNAVGGADIFILKMSDAGDLIWKKRFGSPDNEFMYDLECDAANNIYATGEFSGSIYFNTSGIGTNTVSAGGPDAYVLKLDAESNFVFVQTMGGAWNDSGKQIELDSDENIIVCGTFEQTADFNPGTSTNNLISNSNNTDVFVAKYDGTSGDYVWAKAFTGPNDLDEAKGLAVDMDNNVYVGGDYYGTIDFAWGTNNFEMTASIFGSAFLVKLESNGNFIWAQNINPGNEALCADVVVNADNDIIMFGSFTSPFDFDFNASVVSLNPLGDRDAFVAKWSQNDNNITYCNGLTTFNTCTGTFTDGSGTSNYGNNQQCEWLIQPTDAISVTLIFTAFATEANNDVVTVYNGTTTAAPVLGTFSGSSSTQVTSTGGAMLVVFNTNGSITAQGFEASYNCNTSAPPVADFAATSLSITPGGSTNFNDLSTNLPNAWQWTFEGGNPATSSLQNPTNIIYSAARCYDVTLVATNTYGSNTITKTCYIDVAEALSCTELMISEYVEGSSNNKALELYNPTSAAINLTGYSVQLHTNGATAVNSFLNLSGTLAPGQAYVIANSQASAAILAIADITSAVCNFNGNDAIQLLKNNVAIDVVGQVGVDPGTAWTVGTGSTANNTLVRMSSANLPNASWATVQSEWNVLASDNITNLGTHTITCNQANAPNAAFSFNNTSYCANTPVSFTNTSTNATSYLWTFQDGNPATSTQANPVVSFNSGGNKTVQLTANNGNLSDTYSAAINILTLPVVYAGDDLELCFGSTTQVSAQSNGTASIQWVPATGLSATNILMPFLEAIDDITYTLTVSDGTCSNSDSFVLTTNTIAMPLITANGNTLSTTTYTTYQWLLNNVPINGANAQSYSPTASGNYAVEVSDIHGCIIQSIEYNFIYQSVHESMTNANVNVFPNPCSQDISLIIDATDLGNCKFVLYNVLGKEMLTETITTKQNKLNVSLLPQGIYYYKVTANNAAISAGYLVKE